MWVGIFNQLWQIIGHISLNIVSDPFSFSSPSGIPITYMLDFFFFLRFYFFPFSPQSPPVHSCIFFVVGPSSCGMRDTASAWFDEQCHVRAQDSKQRNTGPPAAECANLTTRPRGRPLIFGLNFLKNANPPSFTCSAKEYLLMAYCVSGSSAQVRKCPYSHGTYFLIFIHVCHT